MSTKTLLHSHQFRYKLQCCKCDEVDVRTYVVCPSTRRGWATADALDSSRDARRRPSLPAEAVSLRRAASSAFVQP